MLPKRPRLILLSWLWLLLLAFLSFKLWQLAGDLPNPAAVHFNLEGRPDRWESPDRFVATMATLLAAVNALLAGITALMARLPLALLNVPRKDYWLGTPERMRVARARAVDLGAILALLVNLMLGLSFHLVAQANGVPVPFVLQGWQVPASVFGMVALILAVCAGYAISFTRTR